MSALVLNKLSIEREPDTIFCSKFIPITIDDVNDCWMALVKWLEATYGIMTSENFKFEKMVTADELSNIYYIYDNYLSCTEKDCLLEKWIMTMHQPQNLSDEVSKTL